MPAIYVTHLFSEISDRASTVIVLDEGRVVAQGTADEVRAPLQRTLGLTG
jgi:ABC-type molybdate transport system ATPase subunit